jgi:hypothetical protein
MQTIEDKAGHGEPVAKHTPNDRPASKWVVIVDDRLIPMPERRVKVAAIREQATVPKDYALLRDHNSPNDVVMPDNGVTDLGDGNVFYTEPLCDVKPRPTCLEPAKLGYSVNDRWEIVIKPEQTGRTIRDLFKLPDDVELLRDFHSPYDETIGDEDAANYKDGPVFIAKRVAITVKVNGHPVKFTKRLVTGLEIKRTAIAQGVAIKEDFALYHVKPGGELGAVIKDGDQVKLHECDEFRAVTTDDNS